MLVSTIYNDKKARTSTIHIFRVLFLFFVNIKRSQVINKWSFSSNDLLTRFRYISYGVWVHRCGFWVYCLKSLFSEQQLTPRKDEKKNKSVVFQSITWFKSKISWFLNRLFYLLFMNSLGWFRFLHTSRSTSKMCGLWRLWHHHDNRISNKFKL